MSNSLFRGLGSLRSFVQSRSAPGTAPGTLTAAPDERSTTINLFGFGPEGFAELEDASKEQIEAFLAKWPYLWVDVDGLGDIARLRELGQRLSLHPLALEDAVGERQRPKSEGYPEHHFVTLRMLSGSERLETEQLSIFFSDHVVVTLQGERPGDCLGPVRARIRAENSAIRQRGTSYLAYALVDTVVDNYFPLLDHLGERLEALELDVFAGRAGNAIGQIHAARHDLLTVRRLLLPTRDAIAHLMRDANQWVTDETRLYLRDTNDHAQKLFDVVELYWEVADGLMEVHFSMQNQKMNDVMRLLTLISTVFIPLSFIAGVYGMNFDPDSSGWNMPELKWAYGYPFALGLMLTCAATLFIVFRRRGWI